MCTVAEASLNRCGLVISFLEFPVVERWVSGLFGWWVVCFGFSGWLVVLDSGFCGFWVSRSFFGVLRVVGCQWVMRCWFGCGWCSMDAGGSVLDFNFWVCVLI